METETNFYSKFPNSYWIETTGKTDFPKLERDLKTDVCVVGGGIAGLTSAYLLKKQGLSVVVIDASHIAMHTTAHTTAKITSQHSLIYKKLIDNFGFEKAKQYADANESAIKKIAEIIKEHDIACDLTPQSAYLYTNSDNMVQKILAETEAANSLGIKASYINSIPLPMSIKGAMRFDNQAMFHPRKYLLSMAQIINSDGCNIYENTRAVDIKEGVYCEVCTENGYKITASKVVIATHYPFYDGRGMYFTRLFPDRSYALGINIREDFPEGMYLSAEEPSRSMRLANVANKKFVILVGERHKTGQSKDTTLHYKHLESFAKDNFDLIDVPFNWSAQDYSAADEVPYIGRLKAGVENIYVASGFYKWGMTNGTAAAMIISDIILKGESPWQSVFSPSRFTLLESLKNIIVENVNVAGNLISGKLKMLPGDIDLKNGEGRVVEYEGKKVGVYMDCSGVLHVVDNTCTHLGCELTWNSGDKSWDCPCHGSRFDIDGNVIECPALKNIESEKR